MMRRLRPPDWYLKGNVHKKFKKWYPWALGLGLGAMYYYAPEPLDDLRSSCLASFRKPILSTYEWVEVRDVDPESLALELPPEVIFGPLPIEEQMKFLLEALRRDDELADMYVTRIIIDRMDLSLDPPLNGDRLVNAGGRELIDFAVDDFLEVREGRKHKFFGGDQFLRLMNLCCGHYQLVDHLIQKHDPMKLIFKALEDSTNEYARVLATRVITMCCFLQPKDGIIEKSIVEGGYLGELVEAYRQSSGDPTDTRFTTLVLSSILRQYPRKAYEELVDENLVQAAVSNLNISRYKGLPQHLRIIEDMDKAREKVLPLVRQQRPAPTGKPHRAVEKLEEKVREHWEEQNREGRWFKFLRKDRDGKGDQELGIDQVDRPVALGGVGKPKKKTEEAENGGGLTEAEELAAIEADEYAPTTLESTLPEILRPKPPPPLDLRWPIEKLLYNAEFLSVALGVLDVYPEYYEAIRGIVDLIYRVRKESSPVELLENRILWVTQKLVERYEADPSFESDGVAGKLVELCESVFKHPACAEFLSPESTEAAWEVRDAARQVRGFIERRNARLADPTGLGAAALAPGGPVQQHRGGMFLQRDVAR